MPVPSVEHAPVMREMSDELLKAFPTASVFVWHVLDDDGSRALKPPKIYVSAMFDSAGKRIGRESPGSKENRIVSSYRELLGWSQREEGIGFAYSVKDAREITDLEGTGTLDPDFEGHPGLDELF